VDAPAPTFAAPLAAPPLVLDGGPLHVADVVAVAHEGRPVELGEQARTALLRARETVERLLERGESVYGLTTGVGVLARVQVDSAEPHAHGRRLVLAHCVGHGPFAPSPVVRAAMLVRAQGLSLGGAGVRPLLVDAYCAALNAGVLPPVHEIGSVGQSDLGPLAEVARTLIGEDGLMRGAGLQPVRLAPKEALAMINANAFSVGWACLALDRCRLALEALDAAAALSFEGFLANPSPLDPVVARVRPYAALSDSVRRLRELLEGGELLHGGLARNLQDPLAFRVVAQAHATARNALDHAKGQVEVELRSAGDNPLVIYEEERAISVGNFDSGPVAAALDYARIGVAHAVTVSGERVQKLLTGVFSGLPDGLRVREDDPDDALAIVGHGAAALAAEVRLLAAPVSIELPTSGLAGGIEDRVTMTPLAARRLDTMGALALRLAAVELVCAAQAVDLRGRAGRLAPGTARLHGLVRDSVPFVRTGETVSADLDGLTARLVDGI
jgi:histidine ammonia-lyase